MRSAAWLYSAATNKSLDPAVVLFFFCFERLYKLLIDLCRFLISPLLVNMPTSKCKVPPSRHDGYANALKLSYQSGAV
jgi:hypothetical protein